MLGSKVAVGSVCEEGFELRASQRQQNRRRHKCCLFRINFYELLSWTKHSECVVLVEHAVRHLTLTFAVAPTHPRHPHAPRLTVAFTCCQSRCAFAFCIKYTFAERLLLGRGVAHLKRNVFALFAHTGSKQTAILAGASRAGLPFPVVGVPLILHSRLSGDKSQCLSTCGIPQPDFRRRLQVINIYATFVGQLFA